VRTLEFGKSPSVHDGAVLLRSPGKQQLRLRRSDRTHVLARWMAQF